MENALFSDVILEACRASFQITQIHPFPLILSPKQVPTKSYANPIFLLFIGTDL